MFLGFYPILLGYPLCCCTIVHSSFLWSLVFLWFRLWLFPLSFPILLFWIFLSFLILLKICQSRFSLKKTVYWYFLLFAWYLFYFCSNFCYCLPSAVYGINLFSFVCKGKLGCLFEFILFSWETKHWIPQMTGTVAVLSSLQLKWLTYRGRRDELLCPVPWQLSFRADGPGLCPLRSVVAFNAPLLLWPQVFIAKPPVLPRADIPMLLSGLRRWDMQLMTCLVLFSD